MHSGIMAIHAERGSSAKQLGGRRFLESKDGRERRQRGETAGLFEARSIRLKDQRVTVEREAVQKYWGDRVVIELS